MTSPPYAGKPSAAGLSSSADDGPPAVAVATEITDHRGEPRLPNRELFGMPPPEIGRVLSAESTLRVGGRAYPTWLRPLFVLAVALLAGAVILYFGRNERGRGAENVNLLAIFAAAVMGVATWYTTRNAFGHRCSYVGEDGVALFKLRRGRAAPPAAQVLVFKQAAELRATQTRQFVNGIYSGTEYDHRWNDAAGRQLLKLSGRYMGKNAPPKAGDPFHFAAAAEVAWSMHYLARAQEQLEREGSIAFRVDKRRVVRVGPGFMEFHFGDEPVRVTVDEIAKVTLGDGQFAFVHKDAKWYRSAGKYRFQYGQMANGKVFFLALDKLMGYRWE